MTSTATATIEKNVAAEAPARATLEIDPARVTIDREGQLLRALVVRMPSGMIADDLKTPEIWKGVQANPRVALRRFDELLIIAYDESWFAEARVADADRFQVVLAKPRLTTLPSRYDELFQDENYKVSWMGSGYVVMRKSDSHVMTSPVPLPSHAERDLRQLYPRPVAR